MNDTTMKKNLLQYEGELSGEVRVQLIDLLQCIALSNLGQRSDLKKLVGIALELLDNAHRYNASTDVVFRWNIVGGELVVTITNTASQQDADRLASAVHSVQRMSAEEIAAAYKQQMTTEGFGEKGGAGLGILQIARKVGNKLAVSLTPMQPDRVVCNTIVTTQLENIPKRA